MKQAQGTLTFATNGQGLTEITGEVSRWLGDQGVATDMLTVYIRHTSASLMIQENADPDVMRDLETFFKQLVREDPSLYRHKTEGPDDMPSHIRAALTRTSESFIVADGDLVLGTWQGIYLFEHRHRPHERKLEMIVLSG